MFKRTLIKIRFYLLKPFTKSFVLFKPIIFSPSFLTKLEIMHLRKTAPIFISANLVSIKIYRKQKVCKVQSASEFRNKHRWELGWYTVWNTAQLIPKKCFHIRAFCFVFFTHIFDLTCWLSWSMIPILFFWFSFTWPTLGYICDLCHSAPFHPNSSLEIRLLEASFFFFLSKPPQVSSPKHCSVFFKSHPSHVFHIASLPWVNKKQNQHKETSELSSLPKHISIELRFLSSIQICSGSVVLPLVQ